MPYFQKCTIAQCQTRHYKSGQHGRGQGEMKLTLLSALFLSLALYGDAARSDFNHHSVLANMKGMTIVETWLNPFLQSPWS